MTSKKTSGSITFLLLRLLAICLVATGISTSVYAQLGIGGVSSTAASGADISSSGGVAPSAPAVVPGLGSQRQTIDIDNSTDRLLEKKAGSGFASPDNAALGGGTPAQTKKKTPSTSDFQKLVAALTGRVLPVFGQNLFQQTAPAQELAVPGDYEVGPGDEVSIRAWGAISVNYTTRVDRNGLINIPKVGTFPVAKVLAKDLEGVIRAQISKNFTNFEMSVALGQLRAVQIYVVGQADAPGQYTVPALSSLVSVIFSVAEPGQNGSFRKIQLKRAGKVIKELDLYEFISSGDISNDARLQNGDVIYIAPVGARVAIHGSVDNPAVFELKSQKEDLASVLSLAGGARAYTNTQKAQLERIEFTKPGSPRVVSDVSLSPELSSKTLLQDGDIVTVFGTANKFQNAVTLRGNVASPLRYAFFPGMRVRDLIPERSALIKGDYYDKKNALVQLDKSGSSAGLDKTKQRADDSVDQVNWDYAVVERFDPVNLRTRLLPFNLGLALSGDVDQNLELLAGDVVTVFGLNELKAPKSKRTITVRITGEVNAAGLYQVENGESLRDLVRKAGGMTADAYAFGTVLNRESTRVEQSKRYEEAISRLEKELQKAAVSGAQSAVSVEDSAAKKEALAAQQKMLERMRSTKPEGRLVLNIEEEASAITDFPVLALEDGDEVFVPAKPAVASVYGSVYGEGSYVIERGDTIMSVVGKAGGVTRTADKSSIFAIRANGTVVSAQQGYVPFVSGLTALKVRPGDTIVVPEEYDRISVLRGLKDIAFIMGQFGLAAAAIKTLR